MVREVVGDERLDDDRFVYLLNRLYKWVNLQHNHFIASMRLLKKRHADAESSNATIRHEHRIRAFWKI